MEIQVRATGKGGRERWKREIRGVEGEKRRNIGEQW